MRITYEKELDITKNFPFEYFQGSFYFLLVKSKDMDFSLRVVLNLFFESNYHDIWVHLSKSITI